MPNSGPTEEEDLDVPEPIPHERAVTEVCLHAMTRGAQAGSILVSVLAVPVCWKRGLRGRLLLGRLGQSSLVGSVLGGAIMAMGTNQKLKESGAWGAYDRAYRLRNNAGQKTLDALSYMTAAVGLFAGTVLLNKGLYGGLLGASSGLSLGVLEYVGLTMYQNVGLTVYERYSGRAGTHGNLKKD